MNKQMLIDVLVVLVAPVAIVALYHLMLEREITTDELLSISTPGEVVPASAELGAKSKEILNQLNSINFDESLFSDPVFLSLKDFTPAYATTTVGREYPFTTPDAVLELKSRLKGAQEEDATQGKSPGSTAR